MGFRKKIRNARRERPLIQRAGMTLKSRGVVRVFKIGVYLISVVFVILGARQLYQGLLQSPYLSIKEIKIEGNMRVDRGEVLELAGVRVGDNLLAIHVDTIKNGIRVNPWVGEVNITRKFPHGLYIRIRERRPTAFINLDGLYCVDETGVVFKRTSPGDDIDLPVITGLTKEDIYEGGAASEMAIKAVNLIHLLGKRGNFDVEDISEIHVDKTYGLTLYTMREGTRIELGDGDFTEKLGRLERVIQARNGLAGVEFIGLDYKRGVIVRLAS